MQGNGNGNGIRAKKLNAAFRRWRGVHLITGFVVALWLVLMAITGVLINHQEDFGLIDLEVSNAYLPAHYNNEYHPDSNGLHVVIGDLHSGAFFGPIGRYIGDLIALLILISVGSGLYSYWLKRRLGSRRTGETESGEYPLLQPLLQDVPPIAVEPQPTMATSLQQMRE